MELGRSRHNNNSLIQQLKEDAAVWKVWLRFRSDDDDDVNQLHGEQFDNVDAIVAWNDVRQASREWVAETKEKVAGREISEIAPYLDDLLEFVDTGLLPRQIALATSLVADGALETSETYRKNLRAAKAKILAVHVTVADAADAVFDPEDDASDLLASPAERMLQQLVADWRHLVSEVHAPGAPTELDADELLTSWAELVSTVNAEVDALEDEGIAGELGQLCQRAADLLKSTVDYLAHPSRPGPGELDTQLSRRSEAVSQRLELLTDYLRGLWLKREDQINNRVSVEELQQFEDDIEECVSVLTEAVDSGASADVSDITASIASLTVAIVTSAEDISSGLSEADSGALLQKVQRLFVLTERQASLSQQITADSSNAKLRERLTVVNGNLLKAAGVAVGAMVDARTTIAATPWAINFDQWRPLVARELELLTTLDSEPAASESRTQLE
eukprot:TRINITY_DN1541_c1_g1_i1.p1 TRINITY_DN1541_c1_g1~~TRINITY_DN1541_c1_g1_i1.p1  ORF type:complete len:448 (+),score=170.82 TRINITY_DN1541_c1_g1_i1:158-1501(+)